MSFLDPTNLIGAGAVSKLGKLAKGVKTVEKQELFYSLLLKQR
jgi:hypothetical protein